MTATSPATNRAAAVAVETGAATAAEATAEEAAVADKSATNVSIPLLLRRIVTDNTQVARSVISLVRAPRLVAIATAAADVVGGYGGGRGGGYGAGGGQGGGQTCYVS